jgi:hypothetical protein
MRDDEPRPVWMSLPIRVHGVVTQCRFDAVQCVLEMEVQYSLTTSGFVSATALDGTTRFFLPTAWSSTAKTMSNFSQPVTARYIRIYPQRWYDAMSMRAGVLTSLPGAAWNACADCPLNSLSGAGSTAPSSCLCNAGTRRCLRCVRAHFACLPCYVLSRFVLPCPAAISMCLFQTPRACAVTRAAALGWMLWSSCWSSCWASRTRCGRRVVQITRSCRAERPSGPAAPATPATPTHTSEHGG